METSDTDGRPGLGGGHGRRGEPGQYITLYIGVDSDPEDMNDKFIRIAGPSLS